MNAIVSSEDIANAMDLRGFGQQKRTWLYELKFHWWDYAVIGFAVVMLGRYCTWLMGMACGCSKCRSGGMDFF
jgi:energy-coupling factor transporter transmembrane protein EcfT